MKSISGTSYLNSTFITRGSVPEVEPGRRISPLRRMKAVPRELTTDNHSISCYSDRDRRLWFCHSLPSFAWYFESFGDQQEKRCTEKIRRI
jgi:hypothetical protein